MARLRFTLGIRYLLKGEAFIVRRLLLEGRLLVENQSFGGEITVTYDDLIAAWERGELRFEVRGPNTGATPNSPIIIDYTIADLQQLPIKQRDETWRRYKLIRPLVQMPPRERTRAAIEAYAASLTSSGSDVPQGRRKRSAIGAAVSARSLQRWLHAFEASGNDIRSLVPATHKQGGKGQTRLDREQEHIIQSVLAECGAAPGYRTVHDVYLMVVNRVAEENRCRDIDTMIQPPSLRTLHRRISAAGYASIIRRRQSRVEAQASNSVEDGPAPKRILERVEIDHTLLDIFLVDEEDRLPIGRPTLTYALDVYSGFPFGIYVGFEPPSYGTVMQCLLHGILPKRDTRSLYETEHEWCAYGLPETLIVDNAKEFVGRDLEDACGQLGIVLEQTPVRTPWFKGSIERFFRTNNTGLIHTLPGTTFSNILERGDYNASQHACISLNAFWQILHIFLLDVYAQRFQKGIGGIPAKRWAENLKAGFLPSLHTSAEELRILLLRTTERTIGRSGIEFESLHYRSPDLARLRSVLAQRGDDARRVRIKYDPCDLSAIYVFDASKIGGWLRVPAVDQGYTCGLSLWKHEQIRRDVLAEHNDVDIYALARAKQKIQRTVASEFLHTRKNRGRTTAARFLSISVDHPSPASDASPESSFITHELSVDESATLTSALSDDHKEVHTPWTPMAPYMPETDVVPVNTSGWSVDYDLPHKTS